MKKQLLFLLLLLPAVGWSQPNWKTTGNAALGTDFLGTTNSEALKLYTNNTERLRISATGNVGLGTIAPEASALLDITSTTQGVLVPRMTQAQRDGIVSPAIGLLIYQTNSTPGFYYYNGNWKALSPKGVDKSLSNLSSPTSVNVDLLPEADNAINLGSATSQWKNLYTAGDATISGLTIGKGGGGDNSNTALGYGSLYANTTGTDNTASGAYSLNSNNDGFDNTASGVYALGLNTDGFDNTAFGAYSLYSSTTGIFNTASGTYSLYSNTWGNFNTASGTYSLYSNTTGYNNTASGDVALYGNTTGYNNTATGSAAGSTNDANTYCTFIGYNADQAVTTDFTNSTALGNTSRITESDQVRIGNSSVTSIGGYAGWTNLSDGRYKKEVKENVPGLEFINKLRPITYHLDVTGISRFLGEDFTGSSVKVKNAGETNPQLEEEKKQLNEAGRKVKEEILYTGFIAQDVEKAAAELGYEFSGVDKPQNEHSLYGLRYAEFVVPLVKAVQELSATEASLLMENESLKRKNAELESRLEKIEALLILPGNSAKAEELNQTTVVLNGGAYLQQNVPNPFDGTTVISYYVPDEHASVQLRFTSVSGEVLQTIELAAGKGNVSVEAGELASGTYQYSLLVNGKVIGTKQMILQR